MAHHFDDVVIVATGIAAIIVSIGVIWRYIVRPIHELGSRFQDHWEYLNDQLTNGGHAGTLREQVNRIEGNVVDAESIAKMASELQELRAVVDSEAIKQMTSELQELRAQQTRQAQAITGIQASLRQVVSTTEQTATAVETVHEAVTNPTGELPVIDNSWPRL